MYKGEKQHEFMSGKALVDYIRKEQGAFDVIFLDIDMIVFFRCHRAFLINMEHILSYSNREICMDNGKKVFLSRQRSNEFKNVYIKWCFESSSDYSDAL